MPRGMTAATVVVAGALLAFPLIALRSRAGAGNPWTKINVNVYISESCDPNPTNEDPKDHHLFTYNVIWRYTAKQSGALHPYMVKTGHVTSVQASNNMAADVDLTAAEDPIPAEIANSNPIGLAPNSWTTVECIAPTTLCRAKGADRCCFGPVDTAPIVIDHNLEYVVQEDPCIDCHYTSCQPDGHTVPKGGGICAPFKYARNDGECTQTTYCNTQGDQTQGCWYEGPYGKYKGKCYILIR